MGDLHLVQPRVLTDDTEYAGISPIRGEVRQVVALVRLCGYASCR